MKQVTLFFINSPIGRGNECLCFCCGRIRTVVALATYSFHRLIVKKVEFDNFCCLIGDI